MSPSSLVLGSDRSIASYCLLLEGTRGAERSGVEISPIMEEILRLRSYLTSLRMTNPIPHRRAIAEIFSVYKQIVFTEIFYLVLHQSFSYTKPMNYYTEPTYLTTPIGNNTIDFDNRKKIGSDTRLRIPQMITGTIDDVHIVASGKSQDTSLAYEYIDEKGRLIHDHGLEYLVEIHNPQSAIHHSSIYIIDNHNHAFYCRWKAYLTGKISRGSHLIHIDQHSDLNIPIAISNILQATGDKIQATSPLSQVATYTNEILDIASFIKPAKEIGLISDYEIILTEYSLLQPYSLTNISTIVDIDLDFRAPEMSIQAHTQTINRVRKLISLPSVGCITISTSPTYINQGRTLKLLREIFSY